MSEQENSLPAGIKVGDAIQAIDGDLRASTTKPPNFYTDATLSADMVKIAKFVNNPTFKKILEKGDGLGTVATRAETIKKDITCGYLETFKQRKTTYLRSTQKSQILVAAAPTMLTDPATTGMWEIGFKGIEEGRVKPEEFLPAFRKQLAKLVDEVFQTKFPRIHEVHPCPECGKPLVKQKSKKGKGFYWACFEHEEALFFPDENGRPGERRESTSTDGLPKAPCPEDGCSHEMVRMESRKKSGFYFWRCEGGKHPLRFDNDGMPGDPFQQKSKKKGRK